VAASFSAWEAHAASIAPNTTASTKGAIREATRRWAVGEIIIKGVAPQRSNHVQKRIDDYMSPQEDAESELRGDEIEPGEEEGSEVRDFAVDVAQHGERLDKVLTTVAPEFSRSHLQGLVADGRVELAGRVVTSSSTRVKAGQRGRIELVRPAQELAFTPQPMALDIVHEDAHVLVVNKPAGLVVHPAAGNWSGTLLNGLLARDPASAALPRAGIVHRLDKDTSGLMVVGRTLEGVTGLVRDIAARVVHRQYIALAHGRLEHAQEIIEAPIGRDPRVRVRMAVVASGRPARTDVEELAFAQGIAAVRCTLHTGRTHQIRVHMAHRGHPLVADETYGGRPALGMTRQALHAQRLAFRHPVTGRQLAFEAPPPADLAAAWRQVVGEA
jgi:23S rRNA pseudouridine1911/1915/1917 synthase